MENQTDIYEKLIRNEITGTLCALKVIPVAETSDELVETYIELMRPSTCRQFHSFQYIATCMLYAREYFKFSNLPITNIAILCHKLGYIPGDKKSVRKTCELTLKFIPSEYSALVFAYIKAMQTGNSIHHRYGDERDYLADIANYFYGTTDYDTFKKNWAKILVEFMGAGYSPQKFKKFSRLKLERMLRVAKVCGMYHTPQFFMKFNDQAVDNIRQMLEENNK